MNTFNLIRRAFLVGVLLGSLVPALPAEPSSAAGALSVAPLISELGAGWGKRDVIYAIDPLEQPAEFVNEFASRNPTNRAAIVRDVRNALSTNGSLGMAEVWYGHYENHLELEISRYRDQQCLDQRWKELCTRFDTNAIPPKVGQAAAWLNTGAGAPGRQFVFRQGLFLGLVSGKVALCGEPLTELVKVTAGKMAKAAESSASPKAATHR